MEIFGWICAALIAAIAGGSIAVTIGFGRGGLEVVPGSLLSGVIVAVIIFVAVMWFSPISIQVSV